MSLKNDIDDESYINETWSIQGSDRLLRFSSDEDEDIIEEA